MSLGSVAQDASPPPAAGCVTCPNVLNHKPSSARPRNHLQNSNKRQHFNRDDNDVKTTSLTTDVRLRKNSAKRKLIQNKHHHHHLMKASLNKNPAAQNLTPTTMTHLQFSQINGRCPCLVTVSIIFIIALISSNHISSIQSQEESHQQPLRTYRMSAAAQPSPYGPRSQPNSAAGNPAIVPQVWARGFGPDQYQDDQVQNDQSLALIVRRNSNKMITSAAGPTNGNNNSMMKSVRHIVTGGSAQLKSNTTTTTAAAVSATNDDICSDRLCYGLPMGCLGGSGSSTTSLQSATHAEQSGSLCSILVTSKRFIDPNRPFARDILFELIALPVPDISNYAAVGFSETGRMQGFVSECLQYKDAKTQLQIIKLKHSYNIPGTYANVPATILSGIKNLGVSFENGYYQCRWIVESAVEFSYEATNGSIITRREDLGYKNYYILLASGEYNEVTDVKSIHMDRISSMAPVSLAQTGHIKSLGSHILIRIHGSLMIAIWVGLVTLSIVLARYYKKEWSNSKINDLAIWFVVHRSLMLTSWFGSIMAVIFAYMYTETYHPGLHQISGTACIVLTTVQILGGLFRPSQESSKRMYFNWAHFVCGNLSYLSAMICLITAAFLAPAHLPPLYIWVIVIFVGVYALTHLMMTIHQYIVHKSSKISITPMSDLNSNSSSTYTSSGFVADSYPKETNSPFRQFMLGIFVTMIVIFIVLLISLVNIK